MVPLFLNSHSGFSQCFANRACLSVGMIVTESVHVIPIPSESARTAQPR